MRIVAVDTETVRYGKPWMVQVRDEWRSQPDIYYCEYTEHMDYCESILGDSDVLTVLHNAKFDLRILSECGIHPAHTECTMQMAYLLGEPALSLKVLAYRLAGIEMRTYKEVTHAATQTKAMDYLCTALARNWPDPDPIVVVDKKTGESKYSFPSNVSKKIQRILTNCIDDPTISPYDKWKVVKENAGRGQVEAELGRMEEAYLDEVDTQEAEEYALLDAEATFPIYETLHARIQEYGLQGMLERDMDCLPMIMEMEQTGSLIDVPVLEELRDDLEVLVEDTQLAINYMAGHYVNPNSSQQVATLLQDEGIYTDLETSTDASILDQYREHAIVNRIQDYRGYAKLKSTYVDTLITGALAAEDGRIHTTLSTTRTDTGRLASSNPNLQNIPVRTELGRRIRKAFIAAPGRSLLAFDYSQIELRVAAHESQDSTMLDIFRNDGDMHMTTACRMFGLPPEEIDDKKHRRPAKTTNFGTIYLIGALGLWKRFQHEGLTQFSEDDCQNFLDSWRETYPGFFEWVSDISAEVRRNGMVRDMFGRIRWIPEIHSSLKYVREAGIRQAVNTPIQSGAGSILKEAMRLLVPMTHYWREEWGIGIRAILQVHDELIFEVDDVWIPVVAPLIHDTMVHAVELDVPVKVDCEVGANWKDLKEYTI